ncbi:putative DNA repair protein Dds20/Mei5 [Aspergillus undulatus]|uniref:putative DNA repair protein Dds20/Mei5 n=1 Tax=Aspergillus undulatus TaxID=1810928 RepID=UPI003CCCB234
MSSYTPNGKRRRLEQASNALSRPFKSPLRRETPTVKEEATSPKTKEIAAESHSEQTNPFPTPPPTRKRTLLGQQRPTSTKTLTPADPEISRLQKQQRELQSRMSTLRSELDTVQQALRIESSNRDDELEALIVKWKKVSQDAAEEVFAGAQERISRMGGVKAWREKMKSNDARWEQEEMESWFGNVDAEGVEFDEEEVRLRKAELKEEIEREKEKKSKEGSEAELESEEFTMDMMLKTLNIELATVGYDKAGQRWIKD